MKLLIVESPGKIKKLNSILKNEGIMVKASVGHVSDLPKKQLGVDVEDNFKPFYEISKDKSKVVKELIEATKKVGKENVILAADEDREGEAIAYHLAKLLKLDFKQNNRITFNSITKDAILGALKNPRTVAMDLVRAQEARRVIDRLVGYTISPILWKKLQANQAGLSAGRVQSAALKLVVEQHKAQIAYFNTEQESSYKYSATFIIKGANILAKLVSLDVLGTDAEKNLASIFDNIYKVSDIKEEEVFSKPQPPFITSTLQQDASKRFKIKVADVMKIAQKLYEGGFITYLRTDSPTLSPEAQDKVKKAVIDRFGESYYSENKFKSKGSAQEAHECIRPARFDFSEDELSSLPELERKVFNLISDRAFASQMQPAKFNKLTITISGGDYVFESSTRTLLFDGYKALYNELSEEKEEEGGTISVKPEIGTETHMYSITANENLPAFPKSYNEATLVKQLENLSIGRPSTYAAILSNILGKRYISIGSSKGKAYNLKQFTFSSDGLTQKNNKKNVGMANNILIPSDTGILLSEFLDEHFTQIFNYRFTANIENCFDEIVNGNSSYNSVVGEFYRNLQGSISEVAKSIKDFEKPKNFKELGEIEGKKIIAGNGKFGVYVKLETGEEKPLFANVGGVKDFNDVTLEMAIEAIKKKKEGGSKPSNVIKEFSKDFKIIKGKFGPCILKGKSFFPIQKSKQEKAAELTKEECEGFIKDYKEYKKKNKK